MCNCCLVAKSCLTLLQPHGLQPARLLCPWDFPGKRTRVCCHFLLYVYWIFVVVQSPSCVQFFVIPWTAAHQASPVMDIHMCNKWQLDVEKNGNSETLYFWAPKSLQMVTAGMKLKDTCSLEEKL